MAMWMERDWGFAGIRIRRLNILLCAGMTIKFFGLFFYERCGLSPVAVSLLATVAPFLVSGASFAAQWGSKWCVHPFEITCLNSSALAILSIIHQASLYRLIAL